MATVARTPKQPDTTTYSGRLAARLRTLRLRERMTVDEFRDRLEQHGVTVTSNTVYAYESGRRKVDLDHIPAIAKALRISKRTLMPE